MFSINVKKRGEIFEDDKGSFIFVCCICNVTNVGLKEVEDHLNDHVKEIKIEPTNFEPITVLEIEYTIPSTIDSILDSDTIPVDETTQFSNDSIEAIIKETSPIRSFQEKKNNNVSKCSSLPNNRCRRRRSNAPYYKILNFDQYKCDLCGRLFNAKRHIYQHLLRHFNMRPHKCTICNKSFTDFTNLKQHLNRHNQIKNYVCNICEKAFCTEAELKLHSVSHSNVRNYICSICGKRFGNSSAQTSHIRRTHYNDKRYVCMYDGCNKKYFYPGQLEVHMRSHTSERPLKCDVCDKTFANPKSLLHHSHLHKGDKLFQCKFCGQKFAQASGRRGHERRVHGAI